MNGVDYSKQLAKDREYYQDALKKTKDAHEQRLSATIDRNDHVQKKQRENFIEDKANWKVVSKSISLNFKIRPVKQ